EIRVKGPNVTPGYFKAPDLTAKAFDEEGWFRTGDAVRLADAANPAAGLIFDGRTAENFKLSSGTWVNVGTLRPCVIAAGAPAVGDGHIPAPDTRDTPPLAPPAPRRPHEFGPASGRRRPPGGAHCGSRRATRRAGGARSPQRRRAGQLHAHRPLFAARRATRHRR